MNFIKKIINYISDNEDILVTLLTERFDNIISESKLTNKTSTEKNFFNVYTYGYVYMFIFLATEHTRVEYTEKLLLDFCSQKLAIHFNSKISLVDEIQKALHNEGPHGAFEFKEGEQHAIEDFLEYYFDKNTSHQTHLYAFLTTPMD